MDIVKLSRPDGWIDRSMIAYSSPEMPQSGIFPNIVITKDNFGNTFGTSLSDRINLFANKQLDSMKNQLIEPVIHDRQLFTILDRPSVEIYLSWLSGQTRIKQRVVFIAYDEEQVVISTATAAESEFNEYRDSFIAMINQLQFLN